MKKIRFIPFGYTVRNGELIVDRAEASVIRDIFDSYIKGASLKDIAAKLTRQGISYSEKTCVWDKARIARIIDNAKYVGDEEYDPIIDEQTYESAASIKVARRTVSIKKECAAIDLIRNRVKCGKCGAPMVRHINNSRKVRESWTCNNDMCGFHIRISDGTLLAKITLMMNRIIENNDLMMPQSKARRAGSSVIEEYEREIEKEMERDKPSEEFIITRIKDIASQLFRETQAKNEIAARIARKRVMMMNVQDTFNCQYFSELIDNISIDEGGAITLHTKTQAKVTEGDENGSPQDSKKDGNSH